MNREIKFRAWDGEKYYYYPICFFETTEILFVGPFNLFKLHKVDCFEQSTELYNNRSQEIWEGDILRVYDRYLAQSPSYIVSVGWDIKSASFKYKVYEESMADRDEVKILNKDFQNLIPNCDIIGNIHEGIKKELL